MMAGTLVILGIIPFANQGTTYCYCSKNNQIIKIKQDRKCPRSTKGVVSHRSPLGVKGPTRTRDLIWDWVFHRIAESWISEIPYPPIPLVWRTQYRLGSSLGTEFSVELPNPGFRKSHTLRYTHYDGVKILTLFNGKTKLCDGHWDLCDGKTILPQISKTKTQKYLFHVFRIFDVTMWN